jgi:hypothetical protein
MATNTYVALDKITVGTAVASVTFSSIPATYTDLVIVAMPISATADNLTMQFNGDTTTNYSDTVLWGSGTSQSSLRETSTATPWLSYYANTTTVPTPTIISIQNYANTTTFKTSLIRANNAAGGVDAIVMLWRKTPEAINSILIKQKGTNNLAVGSTFSLYGIASAEVGAKATGGVISSDASYWYHTFLASGTFTPTQSLSCDYLVVAGGGGGGSTYGGGGGAGGYRTSIGGSPLSLSATGYTVTVGAGGAGIASGQANSAGNGNNSVFSTITSTYGGGGGNDVSPRNGAAGGSGGGGSTTTGGAGNLGAFSPVEGYAGGTGASSGNYGSGGGGGSSVVGTNGTTTTGGNGGAGTANSISGSSVTYAGGGGGGTFQGGTIGAGGAGGGGNAGAAGGNNVGIAGTANTGGGGGGASYQSSSVNGGAGGSGIVIVRYAK